jgi:DNA repair exonuclease SbcCD ATPase subunit
MRNFLSSGNVMQTVHLDQNLLTLILGENIDLGGSEANARNGCGKSVILQAISYGLYGQAIANIKRDNLVNNINKKNMHVIVEFEVNGHTYKIERGRKPALFKYIVDDTSISTEETDEAQGENKETQKVIDKILGMSCNLAKNIMLLNTVNEPFLQQGSAKQRELIEELLGITQLSQKAESLRILIKDTKTSIEQEEFKLKTIKQSNERISNTITEFQSKASIWETKKSKNISDLEEAIRQLDSLDIDSELQSHKDLELFVDLHGLVMQLQKDKTSKQRHRDQLQQQLNNLLSQYQKASDKECPTCSQSIKGHNHEKIMKDLETRIAQLDGQVQVENVEVETLTAELNGVLPGYQSLKRPTTIYGTLTEALNHKNTIDQLLKDLERVTNEINPYKDQAASLVKTLQDVDYEIINKLSKDKDHQEFLLKLLTNKDSFIRKRIIDQNLVYLNARLGEYLNTLGLPHKVIFTNDLSVEISMLGQDLDFHNLSRGEGTRLIIGLSLSFRDIFENTSHAVNLLFIDELLDAGADGMLIEKSMEILKKMARERNKNIFVISHKEELIPRVSNVLTVVKESNFTRFDWDFEG